MTILLTALLFAAAPVESRQHVAIPAVDVVEAVGGRLPLELELLRSDGASSRLADLLPGDRPALLIAGYRRCPGLCDLAAGGLTASIRRSGLAPGEDFVALTVSLDPDERLEDMARERERRLQAIGAAGSAPWWFLRGDEASVRALLDAAGIRTAYDGSSGLWAHPAVTVVLTPDGRVSRYLYGIEPSARDLRLSLVEAAGGRTGTSFDRVLLTCFRWDPARRRYALFVSVFIRTGGLLVLAGLGTLLAVLWRREWRRA